MSSTQEVSSSQQQNLKKSDKGRRVWTSNEEAILIASLKEIIAQGWKSDNGFRAGYLNKLEDAMRNHFPTTDLRANPHINSKMSTMKKTYSQVNAILSKSGAGFNVTGTDYKIDIEDQVWEAFCKVEPSAKPLRYKPQPFYDDWKVIFGNDRATGEAAEDVTEAANDMQSNGKENENEADQGDYYVNLDDIVDPEGAGETNSNAQRRSSATTRPAKKAKTDDSISRVCDILVEIGKKADTRLASLAESLGYEASLGKALEDAFNELGSIQNLTDEDRFEVCNILGTQADKLKIFKGMPIGKRSRYVAWLLTKFHN